jgi:hypothetical protein
MTWVKAAFRSLENLQSLDPVSLRIEVVGIRGGAVKITRDEK